MARDYKNRASTRKKASAKTPSCWIWFVGGIFVGVFACGLGWLKLSGETVDRPRVITQAPEKKKTTKRTDKPVPNAGKQAPKPRFDFYTILPEMEVVVPDPEPEPVKPAKGPAPVVEAGKTKVPAVATATADYMLQMGSFRKHADADRLKASLALVNIEAEIQRFTRADGETFHRVRSGPYERGQVNKLRARLKQNNVSSLVVKLKR
jgi:cell division protein FtsN